MNTQLILVRTDTGCLGVFVNQVLVVESTSLPFSDGLVINTARQLSTALRVPLVECEVVIPDEMDEIWSWSDLLAMLPPMVEQVAKKSLVVYCWQEGGVYPDTEQGPGDAWDELCFDTEPPKAGTPYYILVPAHESGNVSVASELAKPDIEATRPVVDF
jgi:hypothetical protein